MPPRALVWVQHLLGSGHLRRARTLAAALAARGVEVTLASGGPPDPWPPAPGVRAVQLPPLRAADAAFSGLVDADGAPVTAAHWARRRERLLAALEGADPDLVVTEMFPFGRGAFRAEVLGLLDAAKARRAARPPAVAASVRDVLVSHAKPGKPEAMRDLALARYDRVLVHGDPNLLPFAASFPLAGELGSLVEHTGYLTDHAPSAPAGPGPAPDRDGGVLVTAGGGRVGRRLLEAALAARPLTRLAGAPWRLVAGAGLPAVDLARLEAGAAAAAPGVTVDRHHASLEPLLARAVVSVSQAGYNTAIEGAAAGVPMVLVPFAQGREDEQTRRALAFRERGLARVVEEAGLTPRALAAAIDAAATAPPPAFAPDLGGATRSAEILARLAARAT